MIAKPIQLVLILACVAASSATLYAEDPDAPQTSADVPFEDLFTTYNRPNIPFTSLARQPIPVGRSPAAVFVITQEMIRRSGARSAPELLRMVPGLHVARIDGNKWSISSRGFSGRFARKLLVQIDGRIAYTPLFGGTWWDAQDIPLHDIERVEVIRGPGATVWGANAMNGVINFITKSAEDTHGTYFEGGGGTVEQAFSGARIGGVNDLGINWRVTGKWAERGRQFESAGRAFDGSRQGRVGVRADWDPNCCDTYTFQGDFYTGESDGAADTAPLGFRTSNEPVAGGHLQGRWTRTFDEESDMSLQVYYDRTDRRVFAFDQNVNIFDVDFQHRFPWRCNHNVIWGFGYRRVWDDLPTSATITNFAATPVKRTTELPSAFIQDEITLVCDELFFTLGTKISDNAFTDFEIQPSARLLWLPDQRSAAWASVSRAVRTPSRMEHDGRVLIGDQGGLPVYIYGQRDVLSEELLAYEIGYRRQQTESFSWDLALFYNVYEDLISSRLTVPTPNPATYDAFNGDGGHVYGLELAAEWNVTPCWKLSGWYSLLQMQIQADPQSIADGDSTEGASPQNQAYLMSSWDVGSDLQLDVMARYVDALPSVNVPNYLSMDARLAWRPSCCLEFSVVGQNLLDAQHPEYGSSIFSGEIATQTQRGVYGMVTWGY